MDREPSQGKRLNDLTRPCQPGVKSAHRSVLTGIFSVEPERKAKTITAAGATFIHLDLEQGAIANSLCSQQRGWRKNTDPQQNRSNDLGRATKSRSHAEPAVGIPMLASLERQTLLNHDRTVSSPD